MGCSNSFDVFLDKFCSSLYKFYLLLCSVFFLLLQLTVIVLEHHSCCCSESDYIRLTINFSLNYPLTKVFLKPCLHIGVAVCIIISICQFLVHEVNEIIDCDLLIIIIFKVASNLQERFCPFVTLRTSKFRPLEVFCGKLSHWHLFFVRKLTLQVWW